MPSATEPITVALDSNILLAVLLPETTKARPESVRGAERLLRALRPDRIVGVMPAMCMAEVRWAFARSGRADPLQAYHTIVSGLADRLEMVTVSPALAYECGGLRATYYSRANDISYIDALCLATALERNASLLVSTDPHLLQTHELPVAPPDAWPAHDAEAWIRSMMRRE